MIIVVGKWKRKVVRFLVVVALVIAFIAAIPMLTGILSKQVPAFSGWLQEEQPSGNPMRVETTEKTSHFNQVLDQFVIKLQDFYYEH